MTSLKHSSSSGSSFSFFPNPRMEPTKKKKKSLITILLTKLVPLPSSNYKAFFAPPRELFEPSAIKIQYQSLLLLLLLEQILVVPKRIAFQNKPPAPPGYLLLRFLYQNFLVPQPSFPNHTAPKNQNSTLGTQRGKKKKKQKNKKIPTLYSKEFKLGLYKLQPAASFLPSFPRSLTVS